VVNDRILDYDEAIGDPHAIDGLETFAAPNSIQ
jgi:hypothetical protein